MADAKEPRRLLLIAAKLGYQTRMFGEAATRLGVEVVLATDRCHQLEDPWGDGAIPLRFEQPEAAGAALAKQVWGVNGILAVGDRPTPIAAITAEQLGLPYHPLHAVEVCRSKHKTRARLHEAGMPVPAFHLHPMDEHPTGARSYPAVLKPLGLSGSRGVIRVDNDLQFRAAFGRIRDILEQPDIRQNRDANDLFIQVEQFVPGREFALEGVLQHGSLQIFTVFDKPDPLDGPYFEETLYIQPARVSPSERALLEQATVAALDALGLRHGPVHAEMRLNEEGVWILEVAARPIGGLCAKSLRFSNGESLEEILVRHAVGENISDCKLARGASGVMMIPIPKSGIYGGVSGVEEAERVGGITGVEITAKVSQRLLRLPEGNSYLGFLFAEGEHPDHVERSLREAHSKLRFSIATELDVYGKH
ncbi:MAG TPA: ATP-grasp domain-containing protein [Bryobacteraceae bacterium]|jgi:hypothetical protein|nr:ATP-grasp domain-containing protein [Bryobacteraceae bacterium]